MSPKTFALFAVLLVAGPALAQNPPVLGSTPKPTAKDLEEERRFVEGVIDPKYTLDLIVGRPRLILLKAVPTRVQLADGGLVSLALLNPNGLQMTIMGNAPGITVMNLWFTDPGDKEKEVVLSYLLRVLPDPEAKARLIATYAALAREVNLTFPNSRVWLPLVGDKVLLAGQAHDAPEANLIQRVVRP